MHLTNLFLLCIVLRTVNLNSLKFDVISTTDRPTQCQADYFCSALKENNQRLRNLEEQNIQNQRSLEKRLKNLEVALNNIVSQLDETSRQQKVHENLFNETRVHIQDLARSVNIQKKVEVEFNDKKSENVRKSKTFPGNCHEVLKAGNTTNGVYTIWPTNSPHSFEVRCNMDTIGGGWIYVLNRFDGSQEFYLKWEDYANGFGNLLAEFWIGLEKLHLLTSLEDNEILIEVVDWNDKQVHALYDNFKIGTKADGYPLTQLGSYSGNAGDSLKIHVGMKFSTKDKDQDTHPDVHCAIHHTGAWWFKNCYHCHLAGPYLTGTYAKSTNDRGMIWSGHRGFNYSQKKVRMMIRPQHREI